MANSNPSPKTRFKKGNAANPGGKTKDQKRAEMTAATMAAELRARMLSAIMEKVDAGEDALDYLNSDALRLFKDSEDREFGTPVQMIGGDPDRPLVHKVERALVRPKD